MTRRDLLVMAGVLVPFTVLVLVALVVTEPAEPRASPAMEVLPRSVPQRLVEATALPVERAAPSDAGVPSPLDAGARSPLSAPLQALQTVLEDCVRHDGSHLHGPVEVKVAFRPTSAGGFSDVVFVSTQSDPRLNACFEDTLHDARFTPTGAEPLTLTRHTFSIAPVAP
ncbi:MAG: hypothetical protein JNG84_15320 [Archangium sp.]|nr:hypothetical protein [Archangium sp.]